MDRGGGQGRGLGGRTHLLLALQVVRPSTMHLFRDGASFLFLLETPPKFRRSLEGGLGGGRQIGQNRSSAALTMSFDCEVRGV